MTRPILAAFAALTVAVLAAGGSTNALGAPAPCSLVPQLRDVTVNQGLGDYSPLAPGKETLVRLYLSLPQCAASGSSIQVTGGTLNVNDGTTTRIVSSPSPTPAATFPTIATYSAAPALNSTGDPKFVVPGSMLPGSATGFTATFTATINYQSKTSSRATPVPGSTPFSTFNGSAITANVDRSTNPLRLLIVPMGDATKTYSGQFGSTAQGAIQDGMTTVSRLYPVAAGIGNLAGAGGVRYTIAPTLIPLNTLRDRNGNPVLDSAGKFCGTVNNYDAVKNQLEQFMLSWNTTNAATPADRVLGVIDPAIGLGPPNACAEGMAVLGSRQAWVRATSGRAGALIGLEVGHTLGLVPRSRESLFDAGHSPNTYAESPRLGRRYDIFQRAFISDERTLFNPIATPWDNLNTLLERADYAFLRSASCAFGGQPNTECPAGSTGPITAAGPAFVMSGTTDGTTAGTDVLESYFSTNVGRTEPDPASDFRLVQKTPSGDIVTGVPVSFPNSHHAPNQTTSNGPVGVFGIAHPFDTAATRIEFWHGTPGSGTLLYARNKDVAPQITSMSRTGDDVVRFLAVDSKTQRESSPREVAPVIGDPHPRRITSWGPAGSVRRPDSSLPTPLFLRVGNAGFWAAAADATTYTVNVTSDHAPGACEPINPDVPGQDCTLREAISASNANAGQDTIAFGIAGVGPHTIQPTSELPVVTEPAIIDGTTQPGYVNKPIIELDGSLAGADVSGLKISGGNSTVRGLVINRFAPTANSLNSGIHLSPSGGNIIQGNFIGTDINGTALAGNGRGIFVGSSGNTIGGTAVGAGNVISGNRGPNGSGILLSGSNNVIQGNFIGTDVTGTAALGNALAGITATGGTNNSIGGTAVGARNVISGNQNFAGIHLQTAAANTVIQGNYIGTDVTGRQPLGNPRGLWIRSSGNTIGGTATGAGNVISANTNRGIHINAEFPSETANNNQVLGNFVGVDVTGNIDLGNTSDGIRVGGDDNNSTGTIVGGTSDAARNVVSGNTGHGILVYNATNTTVQGNYAGTNSSGTSAIANGLDGIGVDGGSNNTIGGFSPGAGNLASGNTHQGIAIFAVDWPTSTGNVVQGNGVGINFNGTAAIPNGGDGVRVHNASNTTVGGETEGGMANVIAHNGGHGVAIFATGTLLSGAPKTATGNSVSGNSIHSNGGIGIDLGRNGVTPNDEGTTSDLDTGPNNLQNFPFLNSVTGSWVQGRLASTASTTFHISFYSNVACDSPGGNGEGERPVGAINVTTGGDGNVLFTVFLPQVQPGQYVTATASDPQGNTSEFSNCRVAEAGASADLSIAKADSPDPVAAGSNLTYTITVNNGEGPTGATGVSVTDTIPATTSFVSATPSQGTCSGTTTVTCNLGDIANGGSATVRIVVKANTPGTISNTASVTSTSADPNPDNNSATATTTVTSPPPAGQEQYFVSATDDHPQELRFDLFLDCGDDKPKIPVAVGLKPDQTTSTSASFTYNYDPSLACPAGSLHVVGNDGFQSTGFVPQGEAPVGTAATKPVVSIYSPTNNAEFLQYSLIPLRGAARDQDGELAGSALSWSFTGNGINRSGPGNFRDLSPPQGGWPVGTYEVKLTATNGAGSTEKSITVSVAKDADNDGMSAAKESQSCFRTGDEDPLNAYTDNDGDGIPNGEDAQACTRATSYNAIVDITPDPLDVNSADQTFGATIRVPYRNMAQVLSHTVRISKIEGQDVSNDSRFLNTSWSVSGGVGTALFHRPSLRAYLNERGIHNRFVTITVIGRSGAPPWNFEGSDTIFVVG